MNGFRATVELGQMFDSYSVLPTVLAVTCTVIAVSPSVAGFCFRAALVLPAVWAGMVEASTVEPFVMWSAW